MEEEKKEEVCCNHEHKHCKCCGCKVGKVLILIVAVVAIFSLGACFGYYHCNREGRGSDFREFNNQQIGGRMMRMGNDFPRNESGCRFQEVDTQVAAPVQATCPMQTQIQNQTPVKITPAQVK